MAIIRYSFRIEKSINPVLVAVSGYNIVKASCQGILTSKIDIIKSYIFAILKIFNIT